MTGRGVHSAATRVLSALMIVIGVALITQAVSEHASIASPRLLLGALFIAAGGGRLYLQARSREAQAQRGAAKSRGAHSREARRRDA